MINCPKEKDLNFKDYNRPVEKPVTSSDIFGEMSLWFTAKASLYVKDVM